MYDSAWMPNIYYPNGAPTCTAQSCPGWPWGGFNLGPPGAAETGAGAAEGKLIEGEACTGLAAGLPFNGAPTAIAQS